MYDGRSKNMKTTPHNDIDLHIIFQKAHVLGNLVEIFRAQSNMTITYSFVMTCDIIYAISKKAKVLNNIYVSANTL